MRSKLDSNSTREQIEIALNDPNTSSDDLVEIATNYQRVRSPEAQSMRALEILATRGDVHHVARVGCTCASRYDKVMRRAWGIEAAMMRRGGT